VVALSSSGFNGSEISSTSTCKDGSSSPLRHCLRSSRGEAPGKARAHGTNHKDLEKASNGWSVEDRRRGGCILLQARDSSREDSARAHNIK
jgi:hypothetical protein